LITYLPIRVTVFEAQLLERPWQRGKLDAVFRHGDDKLIRLFSEK
jgi:hypothetical protein